MLRSFVTLTLTSRIPSDIPAHALLARTSYEMAGPLCCYPPPNNLIQPSPSIQPDPSPHLLMSNIHGLSHLQPQPDPKLPSSHPIRPQPITYFVSPALALAAFCACRANSASSADGSIPSVASAAALARSTRDCNRDASSFVKLLLSPESLSLRSAAVSCRFWVRVLVDCICADWEPGFFLISHWRL